MDITTNHQCLQPKDANKHGVAAASLNAEKRVEKES